MKSALSYIVKGKSANTPLVFLHGSFGCGEDWLDMAANFSEHFYCVLPDLPGHGAHPRQDIRTKLTLADIKTAVASLIGELNLKPAIVVGYGLGARVALLLALSSPQLVRGLVVENGHPGIEDLQERAARLAFDQRAAERIRRDGLASFFDYWYDLPVFQAFKSKPEELRRLKHERIKSCNQEWTAKVLEELTPGKQEPLWELLKTLRVPALFIAGAEDTKYSALMSRAAELSPHGRFFEVNGAGHNLHLEQPETFRAEFLSFFNENELF